MSRTVGNLVSIVIFAFLLCYIVLNRDVILLKEFVRHKETVAGSMLILMVAFLFGAYGWILILRKMRFRFSTGKALHAWYISQLGKYLPGKIWMAVSRVLLFHPEGRKLDIGYSIIIELMLINMTGICVFLFSLIYWDRLIPWSLINIYWVTVVAALCLVLLHPRVMEKLLNTFLHWVRKEPVNIQLTFNQLLMLFFYYLLFWSVYGVAFAILVSAFTQVSVKTMVVFAGMYVFSIVIGFVSMVTPSGIGVREGVLAALLSTYLDGPQSVYLSVIARIWFTIVELGMVSFFLFRGKREPLMRDTATQ